MCGSGPEPPCGSLSQRLKGGGSPAERVLARWPLPPCARVRRSRALSTSPKAFLYASIAPHETLVQTPKNLARSLSHIDADCEK
jgi:hypothetical protein